MIDGKDQPNPKHRQALCRELVGRAVPSVPSLHETAMRELEAYVGHVVGHIGQTPGDKDHSGQSAEVAAVCRTICMTATMQHCPRLHRGGSDHDDWRPFMI